MSYTSPSNNTHSKINSHSSNQISPRELSLTSSIPKELVQMALLMLNLKEQSRALLVCRAWHQLIIDGIRQQEVAEIEQRLAFLRQNLDEDKHSSVITELEDLLTGNPLLGLQNLIAIKNSVESVHDNLASILSQVTLPELNELKSSLKLYRNWPLFQDLIDLSCALRQLADAERDGDADAIYNQAEELIDQTRWAHLQKFIEKVSDEDLKADLRGRRVYALAQYKLIDEALIAAMQMPGGMAYFAWELDMPGVLDATFKFFKKIQVGSDAAALYQKFQELFVRNEAVIAGTAFINEQCTNLWLEDNLHRVLWLGLLLNCNLSSKEEMESLIKEATCLIVDQVIEQGQKDKALAFLREQPDIPSSRMLIQMLQRYKARDCIKRSKSM